MRGGFEAYGLTSDDFEWYMFDDVIVDIFKARTVPQTNEDGYKINGSTVNINRLNEDMNATSLFPYEYSFSFDGVFVPVYKDRTYYIDHSLQYASKGDESDLYLGIRKKKA